MDHVSSSLKKFGVDDIPASKDLPWVKGGSRPPRAKTSEEGGEEGGEGDERQDAKFEASYDGDKKEDGGDKSVRKQRK